MRTEMVIDQLVAGLQPVRHRTARRDALVLCALLLLVLCAELAIMAATGALRPDMPEAVAKASFWWKLVSLGIMTVLGGGATLLSLDPADSPRRSLRWMLPAAAACLAAGWLLDVSHEGWPVLLQRLDWRSGLDCTEQIALLSLPAAVAIVLMMRRGAPTDTKASAWAAGLAAAGWGAFAFVFSCPYDDPLYVVVWYALGCTVVATTIRLLLPILTRW